jgi:hypothetical protein
VIIVKFSEKLRKTMKDLNMTQAQLCGITGIGKSSISQYLSGRNLPSEERRREMAMAMGLEADYFDKDEDRIVISKRNLDGEHIQRLTVNATAKLMGMGPQTVMRGLRQGVFPWGYAIKNPEGKWAYFINAGKFAEIEGVNLPGGITN